MIGICPSNCLQRCRTISTERVCRGRSLNPPLSDVLVCNPLACQRRIGRDNAVYPALEATTSSTIEVTLNYFKALLNEKRVHPGNNLSSSLIRVSCPDVSDREGQYFHGFQAVRASVRDSDTCDDALSEAFFAPTRKVMAAIIHHNPWTLARMFTTD
jgi:hypothetical protein